jgi:hypothetical protein
MKRNRVLGRQGARELTPGEIEYVTGAIVHTNTVCTFAIGRPLPDGDRGECAW